METSKTAASILEQTLREHELLKYLPWMVCASPVILALDNPAFLVANEDPFRGLPGCVSAGNPLFLPTAYPFLHWFLCLTNATEETSETAACILERTLQEHKLLKYPMWMVCASAIILALDNPAFLVAKNEEPFRGLPGFVSSGNPGPGLPGPGLVPGPGLPGPGLPGGVGCW